MISRSILAVALSSALATAGCMQKSEPAPAADTMAAGDNMAASDNMAATPAEGDMAAAPASSAMAMASAAAAPASSAHYQVTFASRWTAADHPLEYPGPQYLGLAVAHFSGLIGASHKAGYSLFAEGAKPSPGLERLSEMGKHDPLNDEIAAAIQSGQVLALVESTEPLKDHSKTETADVAVDSEHSRVSFVAMIAPSPDWFAGVKDVDLMENGQWVGEKTIDVMPFDSGGDDGATYRADDVDTDPKKPTSSLNGNPHFTYHGKFLPVATVTFKKL